MADSMEAQLIRGGISPAAASVIANAIANRNSQQVQAATQLVDGTQADELRLITPEARRSRYTNLDSVPSQRFATSLNDRTRGFSARKKPHPYENAEPRSTTPRLHTPSITGGDLINVETKVEQDVQQTEISLDVLGSGRHLRISQSRREIDAVDFDTQNETEAKLTNEFLERQGRTTLRSKVNGLSQKDVVLADGSASRLSGWFDLATSLPDVFTTFAKTALLGATDANDAVDGLSEVGAWTPYYRVVSGSTQYELPPEAYLWSSSQFPQFMDYETRSGLYFKLGPLIVFWGRIQTWDVDSSGNVINASNAFHNAAAATGEGNRLDIGGLPYGAGYSSAPPFFQFNYRAPILEVYNIRIPVRSASDYEVPASVSLLNKGSLSQGMQIITNRYQNYTNATTGLATYSTGKTSLICGGSGYTAQQVRRTSMIFAGAYMTTDLSQFI